MGYLQWVDEQNQKLEFNDYYTSKSSYKRRFKLHEYLIEHHCPTENQLNYFEFGVAKGDMIKFWASKNKHEGSRFYGFDSFEGLPESWESKNKGHFDTRGNTPQTEDTRVEFIKGWFQETVYGFFLKNQPIGQVVYHLDADLFSSTLYVLFQIHHFLKRGDILIFDEFSSHEDEYEALMIFERCYGREFDYKVLGAINNYRQVAIQLL